MKVYCLILILFFLGRVATAAEVFEMNRNVRALGMGNAYTAVVDDEDSLFYNPAGIGRNSGIFWSVVDFNFGVNDISDTLDTFSNLTGTSTEFANALNSLYGNPIWGGGHGKTAAIFPFFAAGYYYDLDMSVSVNNPSATSMDVNIVSDEGIAIGAGFSAGIMSFGTVVRRVERTGARRTYGAAAIADIVSGTGSPDDIFNSFDNSGLGYGLDMGINFGFDTIVAPMLSFVIKDIGNTSFRTSSNAIEAPPTQEQEMIMGASMVVDLPLVSVSPAIDIKHLDNSDIQFGKKVHFGIELGVPLLDLRAGYHQGYFSYGAGLNLGFMRIDAASWGVELGEYPGQLEDRRFMLQATMRFGFDVGIGGSGSGGGSGGAKGAASRSGRSGSKGAFRRVKRRR